MGDVIVNFNVEYFQSIFNGIKLLLQVASITGTVLILLLESNSSSRLVIEFYKPLN